MIAVAIFHQGPFAMGGGHSAFVVMNDVSARGEVGLQALPVEAKVRADAWIVRNAKVVIQKELIDRFHVTNYG